MLPNTQLRWTMRPSVKVSTTSLRHVKELVDALRRLRSCKLPWQCWQRSSLVLRRPSSRRTNRCWLHLSRASRRRALVGLRRHLRRRHRPSHRRVRTGLRHHRRHRRANHRRVLVRRRRRRRSRLVSRRQGLVPSLGGPRFPRCLLRELPPGMHRRLCASRQGLASEALISVDLNVGVPALALLATDGVLEGQLLGHLRRLLSVPKVLLPAILRG
jgi:hypothetical protein